MVQILAGRYNIYFSIQNIFMATVIRSSTKKITTALPTANNKKISKSPAKKKLLQKATVNKPAVKIVTKATKNSTIVNTVEKNNLAKKGIAHAVASGIASQKRKEKITTLVKAEKLKAKPIEKVAASSKAMTASKVLNIAPIESLPGKDKPVQPDFITNQKDIYHSNIQPGNKSKSGIKPSGKKPLW
jgi:hypothetical protein